METAQIIEGLADLTNENLGRQLENDLERQKLEEELLGYDCEPEQFLLDTLECTEQGDRQQGAVRLVAYYRRRMTPPQKLLLRDLVQRLGANPDDFMEELDGEDPAF